MKISQSEIFLKQKRSSFIHEKIEKHLSRAVVPRELAPLSLKKS